MTSDNDRLNLLIDLRRFADAEKAAREAIGRNPQWAAGYTHLSRALLALHKVEAIDAAREGARKAPQDAWAVGTLACALNRFGRSKEALEAAEQAVKLDPRYTWARAMLANILCNLNRFEEARANALEGLRFDPLNESLFRWKSWAEYRTGEPLEALRTAEEGLKHHPSSHALMSLIGRIKWKQAESVSGARRLRLHREADAFIREAIRLDPGEPSYHDNLRGNAVSCRGAILAPLVVALCGLVSALPVVLRAVFGMREIDPGKGSAAIVSALVVFAVTATFATSGRCALAAPLDRFRVPTVALTPREHRLARLELWGYGLLMLVPYALLAWGLQ